MISVIVPLYNKSLYIEKCLHSMLNQTISDFEVIVVNDGSTDDSFFKVGNIVKENLNKRLITHKPVNAGYDPETNKTWPKIKLINQPNSGVSAARNNGVRAASYDYIAFLDADDWWEPTYIEEMKSLLEDYPDAGIYGSSYYLVKNGRRHLATIGLEKDFEKGLINYCQVYARTLCMPLWTGATVIPKAIFKSENGFKPVLKFGEDFDLWIRVALKYPVAFLNRPLSNYNQDVVLLSRAVGILHNPENHVLWNLEYLEGDECANPDLKQLLDNLRVYNLFPYFISNIYHKSAKQELKKVDWSKQPSSTTWKYNTPVLILKAWFQFIYLGSVIKKKIIRLSINFKK